jgi:hypothetical protein
MLFRQGVLIYLSELSEILKIQYTFFQLTALL